MISEACFNTVELSKGAAKTARFINANVPYLMSLVVSIPTMCLLTEGHLDGHSDGEDQRRPLTT